MRDDPGRVTDAEAGPIVRVEGVTCRLRRTTALADVSLDVGTGQVCALLGPNGAGKTTLLRVLAGLIRPAAGQVEVAGLQPRLDSDVFRRTIGLLPSGNRSAYMRLSGRENLLFFARLQGLRGRQARDRVAECLDRVGLADAARQRVGTYSQGMTRRLLLARAILGSARVLLLDEATHDLDSDGGDRIRGLALDAAAGGAAVLWATQRLDEVLGFAGRVCVLDHGQVRFDGAVRDLTAQVSRPRFLVHLVGDSAPGALASWVGDALRGRALVEPLGLDEYRVTLDGVTLGEALARVVDLGIVVLSCREERSSVEVALRALTGAPPLVVTAPA